MKQMNIKQFIYWLRTHGFRPEQFGTGSKKNPIRLKSIGIQCDRCKEIFEHSISEFSLRVDTGASFDYTREYLWFEHEGKHYCLARYEYDSNDEIVIKPIDQH